MKHEELRRYTELPWLIQMLETKKITMLSPSTWDDRNDAHFVDSYRARRKKKGLVAICLTGVPERYHHWKVFAAGPSGVCIVFHRQKLIDCLKGTHPNIICRNVRYREKAELAEESLDVKMLPFTKQWQFKPDAEYRFILELDKDMKAVEIDITLDVISHIVLSPWLPRETQKIIRDLLKIIPGCGGLTRKVSTLVEDQEWMSYSSIPMSGSD